MAYTHENPNINYEMGAWDYYINEVNSFNEKLDRYQEEVNQKLADQDTEIADFKTNVNNQILTVRQNIATFEESIRNWQEDMEEQYQQDYNALVEQVDRIVASMREYVWSYMAEEGESLLAGGQVVFTCEAHGVGENITVSTDVAVADLVTLINNNKFQPLVTYIDGGKSRFVPDDWEANISSGNNLLIYIYGSTYGNSVIGNKRFKITYQAANGNIVNNVFEVVGTIRDPYIHYVNVTVTNGEGIAYFSNPTMPTLISVSKIGETTSALMFNSVNGGTGSTDTCYPNVILGVDSEHENTYYILVRAVPTTSGTFRVVLLG